MHTQTRNMDVLMLHTSKTIFTNECEEIAGKLKIYKGVDELFMMVSKYIYMTGFMEEDNGRFTQVKYAALVAKTLMNASAAAGASAAAATTAAAAQAMEGVRV